MESESNIFQKLKLETPAKTALQLQKKSIVKKVDMNLVEKTNATQHWQFNIWGEMCTDCLSHGHRTIQWIDRAPAKNV